MFMGYEIFVVVVVVVVTVLLSSGMTLCQTNTKISEEKNIQLYIFL
jgi:hypothetical protein